MHSTIKRIISCIMVVCLTIGLLGYLTNLMERKSSDYKYVDFFEQEEDFNVLFMGTSHMINDVFPMELWNSYGIVSYNFGGHRNQLATSYWTMENALDYTTPDVVVIDCLYVSKAWKSSDIFSFTHLSLDAFPLSTTKVRTVWDLLDDKKLEEDIENGKTKKSSEPRTKIGLLWDYSVYHSRWNELTQEDFDMGKNLEKGAESRINVEPYELDRIDPSLKIEPGTVGDEYLRKMIEDCQSRGIEVLLTYLPFSANKENQMEANYIYDLAEEYGVNYINFLDMDLVDYQTDCYDNSHMNPSGARKVTDYLGEYLINNYNIPDQRNNTEYAFWNDDYIEYVGLKNTNIQNEENILNYFMLVSHDNLDMVIDVKNKEILHNDMIKKLLNNCGIDISKINDNTDFIIVTENNQKVILLDDFRQDGCTRDTEIGVISLKNADGLYELYIDGEQCFAGITDDNTGIGVRVTRDNQIVDDVRFVCTVDSDTVNVLEVNRN